MAFGNKSTLNPGSPVPVGVSLTQPTATANDVSTVNYTGSATSPPTGFKLVSSNATTTFAAGGTEPTALGTTGFISSVNGATTTGASDANLLGISSIAAGVWTIQFTPVGGVALGPTAVQFGIRAWQVNDALTSSNTIDLSNGTNANRWVYTASMNLSTTPPATITITTASLGAISFNSATPYLYFEIVVRVVTGGSNLTALAIKPTNTIITTPAISYSRTQTETVTTADVGTTRSGNSSFNRTQSETVGVADATNTRILTANRTITETVGVADVTTSRVAAFNRTQTETVGPANASASSGGGSSFKRTQTETVGPASVTNTRTASFNRTQTENLTAGGGTTVIKIYPVLD